MKNNPEHHELCEMAEYERDEREHFALCFHINICILAQVPLFCLSIHLFYATHTHRKGISLVKHSRRNGVREDSWSVIYVQTIAKCCYWKREVKMCTRKIKTLHLTSNGIHKFLPSLFNQVSGYVKKMR